MVGYFIQLCLPLPIPSRARPHEEDQQLLVLYGVLILGGLVLGPSTTQGQDENRPGRSIGKVSTQGDLIVMELDEGVLGKTNLFDLAGRTLRFTPESSRYRVESTALQWDPEFGPELAGSEANLHNFTFPFRPELEFVLGGNQWINPLWH